MKLFCHVAMGDTNTFCHVAMGDTNTFCHVAMGDTNTFPRVDLHLSMVSWPHTCDMVNVARPYSLWDEIVDGLSFLQALLHFNQLLQTIDHQLDKLNLNHNKLLSVRLMVHCVHLFIHLFIYSPGKAATCVYSSGIPLPQRIHFNC